MICLLPATLSHHYKSNWKLELVKLLRCLTLITSRWFIPCTIVIVLTLVYTCTLLTRWFNCAASSLYHWWLYSYYKHICRLSPHLATTKPHSHLTNSCKNSEGVIPEPLRHFSNCDGILGLGVCCFKLRSASPFLYNQLYKIIFYTTECFYLVSQMTTSEISLEVLSEGGSFLLALHQKQFQQSLLMKAKAYPDEHIQMWRPCSWYCFPNGTVDGDVSEGMHSHSLKWPTNIAASIVCTGCNKLSRKLTICHPVHGRFHKVRCIQIHQGAEAARS